MLNLDTHILIYALSGDLSEAERHTLVADRWSISAIVLWELAKLVQLGRLELDLESPEFTRTLASLTIWPLDRAVCRQSTHLDFSGDPADELIAATSVVHHVPLVTRDRRMRGSKIVPLAQSGR